MATDLRISAPLARLLSTGICCSAAARTPGPPASSPPSARYRHTAPDPRGRAQRPADVGGETRLYAVVGPEPHGAGELDLPHREQPSCPPAAQRPSAGRHAWLVAAQQRPPGPGAGWVGGGHPAGQPNPRPGAGPAPAPAAPPGWLEANAHLGPQYRQVVQTLAWRRRATGLAVEADRPGYVLEALGPVPASTRGQRAWRQAAAEIEQYRHTYSITDPDRAWRPRPRVHLPGAGLALGAAIGVVLGVLAGGGVAIAFGVAGGTTLGLLLGGGRPALPVANHHQ
jgi:hypothetical protein